MLRYGVAEEKKAFGNDSSGPGCRLYAIGLGSLISVRYANRRRYARRGLRLNEPQVSFLTFKRVFRIEGVDT
jgi:hypothetical protein